MPALTAPPPPLPPLHLTTPRQPAPHEPRQMARIATVAHELRSPLAVILGYAYTLLDGDACGGGEAREFMEIIAASAEQLSVLVEDLLDTAKLEAGAFRLQCEPVRVERIVRRVLSHRRALAPRHELREQIAPDLPLVEGDAVRLEQVVSNLVENAIKYSPDGGAVTVRVSGGAAVTVSVSDEGAGIDPAAQARLFEPFYRADGDLTRRTRGAGLGLSICKRLMEAHGGRIWVQSAPGAGSTFSFALTALVIA